MKEKKHIRGSKILNPKEYEQQLKENKETTDLPFGYHFDHFTKRMPIQMPLSAEPKPTSIIGRPGVGKTVLMSQIIARLKERNERGLIYDFKGDMISRFYDPSTDIIINPLDKRSTGWSLLRNEIKTKMDINSLAASLIPLPHSSSNADPFFNEGARDVFAGILYFLHENGYRTNRDIWEMVSAPGVEINRALQSVPGGARGLRYIEDASSKQAISILSVMMQYVKCFEYMTDFEGDFSINDWLDSGKGMIFISNYADIKETLKPILSLFIDLFSRRLLSLPDSNQRSIFIMLTEFGTLQRLSSIVDLFTNARSKGGKCYMDIQDFGQIDNIYGQHHRQSILNACGNFVTFALADNTAAKIASERLGEAEYTEIDKSASMGVNSLKDGVSFSEKTKKESLFLPSEIIELPELTGIVRFANYGMLKTKLEYVDYPTKHKAFDMVDDVNLEAARDFESQIEEVHDEDAA
jgi:type IV secretory pathway TraG/TraD family ATPase VirD4